MKFLSTLATLAVFALQAHSIALSDDNITLQRRRTADPAGSLELLGRATESTCKKTSCKGTDWSPGLHCGDGLYGCKYGDVFQVGSATNVCDFGPRDSCKECGALKC